MRDCDFIYSNPALYGTYVINFTRFHDPFEHFSDEPLLQTYSDSSKDTIIDICIYKQFRYESIYHNEERSALVSAWQFNDYTEEMRAIAYKVDEYPYPGNKSIKKRG